MAGVGDFAGFAFGNNCEVPELLMDAVGLDGPLRELNKLFFEDGVSMVVLTGPGGFGKTFLALKFCKEERVKVEFKNNILFVNISKEPNLQHIVQKLYLHKGDQVPNNLDLEVIAFHWLQQFLEKAGENPLLVVLDDVCFGSEYIVDKFNELKTPKCKILVTSRCKLPRYGSPLYLESLDEEDARTLFRQSASLRDMNSDVPEDLQEKIIKRCEGIPLVIIQVGIPLSNQRKDFWEEKEKKWSEGSSILDSDYLLRCLKSSLEAFDTEKALGKECFMDLGSFPKNQNIPAAALIDMWEELYELDDVMCIVNLYELINRSLVVLVKRRKDEMEADGYYSEHIVKQHAILRELAIYLTKPDPVENRKRLIIDLGEGNAPEWLTEQKYQTLKARLLSISFVGVFSTEWHHIQLPEVEVLVLNSQTKDNALPRLVRKLDKLKVLVVSNYSYEFKNYILLPADFQLLGSLSHLKRIRLERISIPALTLNPTELKSLRKISLFECNINKAFSESSIQIFDALPNLLELDIDNCKDLENLPKKLCYLSLLKKLSLTNCQKLSALPEEIGNLMNLEVLRLRSCIDLSGFPFSIQNLNKLNFLDIYKCFSIKEFPEDFGKIRSLRKINMILCSRLQTLPPSVLALEALQEVVCDTQNRPLWDAFPTLKQIRFKVDQNSFESLRVQELLSCALCSHPLPLQLFKATELSAAFSTSSAQKFSVFSKPEPNTAVVPSHHGLSLPVLLPLLLCSTAITITTITVHKQQPPSQ